MFTSPPPSPLRKPLAPTSTPAPAPAPAQAPTSSSSSSSSPSPTNPTIKGKGKLNARADASKLKIRAVPYSPPRLSSDGSASASAGSSSRPVSYITTRDATTQDRDDDELSPLFVDPASSRRFSSSNSSGRPSVAVPPNASAELSGLVGAAEAGVSDPTPQIGRHAHVQIHSSPPTPTLGMKSGNHAHAGNDPGLAVHASSSSALSPMDRPSSATSSIGSHADDSRSRKKRVINLHAGNKTFSLAPLSGSLSSRTDSSFNLGSATGPPSLTTPSSSYGRVSSTSAAFADDRPVSPLSSLNEHPGEYHLGSAASPASTTTSVPDMSTTSPWNYRLVGGLRKVRQVSPEQQVADDPAAASDPELSRADSNASQESSPYALPPHPSSNSPSYSGPSAHHGLAPQGSFESSDSAQSGSTLSDRTNYKVYGQSSPVVAVRHRTIDLEPRTSTSSSHSDVNFRVLNHSSPSRRQPTEFETSSFAGRSDVNYRVLGRSSTIGSESIRECDQYPDENESFVPPSPDSNVNFQVYDNSSFRGDSVDDFHQITTEDYSSRRQSFDEHIRPDTGDSDANFVVFPGASSDLSLVPSQSQVRQQFSRESLVVAPLVPGRKTSHDSFQLAVKRSTDSLRSKASFTSLGSILTQEAARALFVGPTQIYINPSVRKKRSRRSSLAAMHDGRSMIESHPHQWSSQLSTVPSESEPSSRALSPTSDTARRSSGLMSFRSQRMRSISSSIADPLSRSASRSLSHSDTLDRPHAAHVRQSSREAISSPRLVRDHDEDGDGLADLEDLRQRPSRSRLRSLSHQSSDRSLRSRASSRSRSESLKSQLPGWAKVYYGSGERRFVISHPSSESMYSLYNESPRSSFINRTPSMERFMIPVRSPFRRPQHQQQSSLADEMPPRSPLTRDPTIEPEEDAITQASHPVMQIARRIRKQTSSVWSPHLGHDKRASRYSLWEPPSTTQSDEAGVVSRRNAQVGLFIAGFVLPLAWMVAAFLPMPPTPKSDMEERAHTSSSELDQEGSQGSHSTVSRTPYSSARWWRNLNRIMSIIGLLIIGAVVALAVIGVKQWKS